MMNKFTWRGRPYLPPYLFRRRRMLRVDPAVLRGLRGGGVVSEPPQKMEDGRWSLGSGKYAPRGENGRKVGDKLSYFFPPVLHKCIFLQVYSYASSKRFCCVTRECLCKSSKSSCTKVGERWIAFAIWFLYSIIWANLSVSRAESWCWCLYSAMSATIENLLARVQRSS